MIDSPWLDGRDRYERTMEGWVDNAYDHAFTHSVQIGDDRLRVELSADCTPSPGYEVRAARARVFSDDAALTAAGRFEELAGARMIGGFTRRLTEVAGSGPASRFLVDAGIEVARDVRRANATDESRGPFPSGDPDFLTRLLQLRAVADEEDS